MNTLEISRAPAFTVTDPEGATSRQEIREFPFRIGRQSGNHLLIRDARASRNHAEVTIRGGRYVIEDLGSRHGVYVNGESVQSKPLEDGDRIQFGFDDSYTLIFELPETRVTQLAEHLAEPELQNIANGSLARLRAVLEVARVLQTSFSVDSVLCAVVDAAIVVTTAERGFLLIRDAAGELQVRCSRDRRGPLRGSDLEVPRNLIRGALDRRAHTYSVQFDGPESDPSASAYALDLKSAVCIPLVRVQMVGISENRTAPETIGALYLDSRSVYHDMADGNRELLETLGIEASTVLENARLLEEERANQHVAEELSIARGIQQSLLPAELPETGWFRATGHSSPSREVGGDYYDVFPIGDETWAVVVADVAGKGVSSALVASLLQGAFLGVNATPEALSHTLHRLNAFFRERTEGLKHATIFCALIHHDGRMDYINAGHCGPVIVPLDIAPESFDPTAPPVGLLDDATFPTATRCLAAGDRIVVFSDGLTESHNAEGEFFGRARLNDVLRRFGDRPCSFLHQAILDEVDRFTGTCEQFDDLTLLVLEYRPT